MDDIRQYQITRTFFNKNRWFVAFRKSFNGKKVMARAIHNWLLLNPQFEDLPPGYCIHHLDLDELNDDISNLALMKQPHHIAYHLKQQPNKHNEKVKLRPPVGIGRDLTIPRVSQSVSGETQIWRFRWQETDIAGNRVSRQINRINDQIFRTEKEAEKGKKLFMKIHPSFKSKEELHKIYSLIEQINQEIEGYEMDHAYRLIKKTFPQI